MLRLQVIALTPCVHRNEQILGWFAHSCNETIQAQLFIFSFEKPKESTGFFKHLVNFASLQGIPFMVEIEL